MSNTVVYYILTDSRIMTQTIFSGTQNKPTIAGSFSAAAAAAPSAVPTYAGPHLSQATSTGLYLGPIGTPLYWVTLVGIVIVLSYLLLFIIIPFTSSAVRRLVARLSEVKTPPKAESVVSKALPLVPIVAPVSVGLVLPDVPREYSSYDGFKSFAREGALAIEDIVKGLSQEKHAAITAQPAVVPAPDAVKASVEPIAARTAPVGALGAALPNIIAPLIAGDRAAVFADLREFVRGGKKPEELIYSTAFLLDDAYRARVDGYSCESATARLTAKLDTPTLEKLIAALVTAIDSSYSDNATSVKLAITRAFAVLGA